MIKYQFSQAMLVPTKSGPLPSPPDGVRIGLRIATQNCEGYSLALGTFVIPTGWKLKIMKQGYVRYFSAGLKVTVAYGNLCYINQVAAA